MWQRLKGLWPTFLTPTRSTQLALALVGVTLVAIAVAAVFGSWDRSDVKTTTKASTVVVKTKAASPTTKTTKTSDTGASTSPSKPSDSVIGSLLGAGLVLFLAGLLLPRITGITLPGGAGITLGEQAKVATDLATRGDERLADPENFERALLSALRYYAGMATAAAPPRVRPVGANLFRANLGYVMEREAPSTASAADLAHKAVDLALADL
jgi:hypothetical protein